MTSLFSWTTCPVEFRVTIGQHQYSQAENSWLKSQKLGVKITLLPRAVSIQWSVVVMRKPGFFLRECFVCILSSLLFQRTEQNGALQPCALWRALAYCSRPLLGQRLAPSLYLPEEFGLDHFESRAFTFSWMVKHFGKLQFTQHTSVKLENTNSPQDYKSVLLSVSRIMHTGYVPKMLDFHLCLTHPLLAQSIFQKVIYCSSEGSSIFEISHLAVNEIKIWSWLNLSITCSWAKTIKTVLSN